MQQKSLAKNFLHVDTIQEITQGQNLKKKLKKIISFNWDVSNISHSFSGRLVKFNFPQLFGYCVMC